MDCFVARAPRNDVDSAASHDAVITRHRVGRMAADDRLQRVIQYAAAYRFYHRRLWISIRHPEVRALARLEGRRPGCGRFILRGSLRSRLRMTGIQFRISRRIAPEVCRLFSRPLENQRAQGMPDARCTRGLMRNGSGSCAHEHTGQRRQSDIPCAMALRLITRSPR
jgi:hypothetical protein